MKLIKALVALLVVAGLVVPVVAVAEDRLSLSGEMRVRGWHTDYDLDDVDDSDSTETWADQRLRIAGKLAVAEGVSITFRTDITESNWGSGNINGSGRTSVNGSNFQSQHWDRAHIDLVKGDFHLRAGQQYNAFGKTYALDNQSNGITLFYNGIENTKMNIFFALTDDNGGKDEGDAFLSGITVRPKFGDVQTAFFVANYNDGLNDKCDTATDDCGGEDVTLLGAYVATMFGPVNFTAEVDVFTGDAGWVGDPLDEDPNGDSLDAYGTQVWLDGSMAATDAFTVGANIFYGAGDDEDVQYTYIGSGFGGWDPLADVGTSLSNEQITYDRPFNVAEFSFGAEGDNISLGSLGAMGGRLYTSFKASEDLTFGASIAYAQEEEDKFAELDYMLLAGGLVYQILPNASFQVQLQYIDGSLETDIDPDNDIDIDFDGFEAGTGLFVKF